MDEAITEPLPTQSVGEFQNPLTQKDAKRLFTNAASLYFRSGVAQAARIAQLCQEQGYNPLEAKKLLLGFRNRKVRRDLVQMAFHAHRSSTSSELPNKSDINVRMNHVIENGFTYANSIMHLNPSQIEEILAMYPPASEDEYANFVDQLIENTQAELEEKSVSYRPEKPWHRIFKK